MALEALDSKTEIKTTCIWRYNEIMFWQTILQIVYSGNIWLQPCPCIGGSDHPPLLSACRHLISPCQYCHCLPLAVSVATSPHDSAQAHTNIITPVFRLPLFWRHLAWMKLQKIIKTCLFYFSQKLCKLKINEFWLKSAEGKQINTNNGGKSTMMTNILINQPILNSILLCLCPWGHYLIWSDVLCRSFGFWIIYSNSLDILACHNGTWRNNDWPWNWSSCVQLCLDLVHRHAILCLIYMPFHLYI